MYELIDAINRLGIDNFNDVLRKKISEGNFSRSPADLSAVLYYLASLHKMYHQKLDAQLYLKVLREIKHMQTENLKIEHMHYLLKSFALSIDADFL